jgi:signal transduction histidine kinase/ActR/RegA family two-component response regulator
MWAHLALFALTIVVPLWCALGALVVVSLEGTRREYESQTMIAARSLAQELDRELTGLAGMLRALATSPALADGDLRRFHGQASRVVPEGGAIVLRDRTGQQLVNTLFPFGTALPVTGAPEVRAADDCVFRTAATCISDLYIGSTDRQPYVLLNAPVVQDGEVAFALNVGLRASHLAAILAGHRLPAGWVVSIIDLRDRIVARSLDHERFVGTLANAALRGDNAAREGTVRTVNVAGVPVWGAFVRMPNWGWRVAIGVPESVLDAPLRQSLSQLAWAGLAAVALSIAAALVYGRRLARPIHELSRAAAQVDSLAARPGGSSKIQEVDQVFAALAAASQRLRASVAERDQAQAELRRLNADLRAQVEAEVAAREEAQARLAQARRMEALGRLAGGIAHDFNNVLQAVQGGARLIEKAPDAGERSRRVARMVAEAASRGGAVTRRLLAFARRADLRAEPVEAAELLAAMEEMLAHTLGAGIAVRVEAAPGLPPLLADRGQLETVLVNLAANARDAMPEGGRLLLSATVEEVGEGGAAGRPRPGRYLRLAVSDTGHGMDAATLARASEPFFTTKAPGQGTGLGLAMARGFAEQSGGALAIESAPGQGSTVSLWLPAAEQAGSATAPPATARPMGGARRQQVLLVDDEPLVRTVLAEGLAAHGFAVRAAGSGAEALDLLDAGEAVDAMVTDLSMPAMDGLALIREARERRPALPCLLLTGFAAEAEGAAEGLGAPFALLRKPVEAAALAERLGELVMAEDSGRGAP